MAHAAGRLIVTAHLCTFALALLPPPVSWSTITTEPGKNEDGHPTFSGGMPLGNGDLVAYAWVNASAGGIGYYVAKADAFNSDTLPFKLAMGAVTLSPNPFAGGGAAFFNQSLDMGTATFSLEVAASASTPRTTFTLWIDALTNAMRIAVHSPTAVTLTASLVSVRPPTQISYAQPFTCGSSVAVPDVALDPLPPTVVDPNSLVLFHRNDPTKEEDYFAAALTQQGLAALIPTTPNVFSTRQFGCLLAGDGVSAAFTRASPTHLTSAGPPRTDFALSLTALTTVTASSEEWVDAVAAAAANVSIASNRVAHVVWWASFWARSHVVVGSAAGVPNGTVAQLNALYAATRFVQAVQSRTDFPIPFNGMLFGAATPDVSLADNGGPDFRQVSERENERETCFFVCFLLAGGQFGTCT